jgi:hypothetical protein
MTPECDAVRLSSNTDEKVLFIPGREIKWDKSQIQQNNNNKLGKFISVVPCGNDNEKYVVPVEWEFYSVRTYDLKMENGKNEIKKYQRYYKMRNEYAKQIQAKYIGYFLRNGVDELFIKDKNVIFGDMLIDMIM